jgi:hypothetical protein
VATGNADKVRKSSPPPTSAVCRAGRIPSNSEDGRTVVGLGDPPSEPGGIAARCLRPDRYRGCADASRHLQRSIVGGPLGGADSRHGRGAGQPASRRSERARRRSWRGGGLSATTPRAGPAGSLRTRTVRAEPFWRHDADADRQRVRHGSATTEPGRRRVDRGCRRCDPLVPDGSEFPDLSEQQPMGGRLWSNLVMRYGPTGSRALGRRAAAGVAASRGLPTSPG